jgi:hypothetical protein
MAIDKTSVPRWKAVPGVDAGGRTFALVSLGDEALPLADRWAAAIGAKPLWRAHADRLEDGLLTEFRRELGGALVGWRLMLAGPEDGIQVLRAAAVAAGALQCEIRAHATSTGLQRVYCAHCRTVGLSDAGVGGVWRCPGCGLDLAVHPHHSRRLAAYLGSQADADEAP